ncbi:hypothetical protein IAR55_000994 [Kwoniella newhampshirensis]|uniref:FAD/NAD(P)-binding domain-containing protein n=1 Tax=Kwoniella newhampshirensis TaxID=1651941 RepID=A0AAW0Z4E3_9TREE
MTSVNLLVIGGGPAGLSAAAMFSRLRRSCLIYDSGSYRNATTLHSHTISGYEGVDPAIYRQTLRGQLKDWYSEKTEWRKGKIVSLLKVEGGEGGFEAIDEEGREIKAKKVILATGVKDRLPDIPGMAEQWGRRVIHCIFCHGTETAKHPFAFLYTKANAPMNAKMVEKMLTMWTGLDHEPRYILANGIDVDTEEGRKDAGFEKYHDLVQQKGYKYITSAITSVKEDISISTSALEITFGTTHPPISVHSMLVFPEKITPSTDAEPLLTENFLQAPLGAMGIIAPPKPGRWEGTGVPFRIGDDPRTEVRGLFWAGNSGCATGNVTVSVAQGQLAGAMAGDELGHDELMSDIHANHNGVQ